jgi:hypothetical protein
VGRELRKKSGKNTGQFNGSLPNGGRPVTPPTASPNFISPVFSSQSIPSKPNKLRPGQLNWGAPSNPQLNRVLGITYWVAGTSVAWYSLNGFRWWR